MTLGPPPLHLPLDLPPSIKIYFRRMLMTQNYSESTLDFEGFMAFIRPVSPLAAKGPSPK